MFVNFFTSCSQDGKIIWGWVFPFPRLIPQYDRFWLTSCLPRQALLGRIECSGIFQNVPFPVSPPEAQMDFSSILLWSLSESHNAMAFPLWLGPSGVFKNLRGIHTKSPAVCQLHFRFFFPNTGSALMASALDSRLSQDLRILRVLTHLLTEFSCLSFQYLGQLFALCPLLSYGPKKRVADFIVC